MQPFYFAREMETRTQYSANSFIQQQLTAFIQRVREQLDTK